MSMVDRAQPAQSLANQAILRKKIQYLPSLLATFATPFRVFGSDSAGRLGSLAPGVCLQKTESMSLDGRTWCIPRTLE
jgi:hypothetical protein